LRLDDAACKGREDFVVPAKSGKFIKKGSEDKEFHPARYIFSRPGTIVYMGAHLHLWEGGEKLDVFLNDNLIMTFTPTRTSQEPWSWIIKHTPLSVRINTGDELSITATYLNNNPVPIGGAMGIMGFGFAPDQE